MFKVNSSFFDNINSSEKAYILGFWYADGYNYQNNRYRIVLNLQEEDRHILESIRNILEYEGNLLFDKKYGNRKNQYRLSINNKGLSIGLSTHGCMQTKTEKLKFPTFLSEELIPHFIRGYFDGDGSIYRCLYLKKYFQYGFSIIGTEDMIISIGNYFKEKLNLSVSIGSAYRTKNKKGNPLIKELRIGGKKNMIKIMDLLYENKGEFFLTRKYDKYLLFKNDKTSLTIGRK